MTPDEGLEALLAEHTAEWTDWDNQEDSEYYSCLCRKARWHVNTSADYYAEHAKHVAAVIAAAGWRRDYTTWETTVNGKTASQWKEEA